MSGFGIDGTSNLLSPLPLGLNLPFAAPQPTSLVDQLTASTDISNYAPPDLSQIFPQANTASAAGSIIPNLPAATARLSKKYATLASQAQSAGISPTAYNAVLQYDAQRVGQGAQPLSNDQTALALRAADTQLTPTAPPQRSIWNVPGNAISDITDIAQSIPKLPIGLFNTVKDLPNFPKRIAEAQAAGANPITALAQAPGVNLIPGSYVVGQAAKGPEGLRELATHPVQTALDVLPAASKLAEGTEVAKAAALATESDSAAARALGTKRPIRAVLTRALDEHGNLTPTRVGQLGQAIMDTSLGQTWQKMFGPESRAQSTMAYTSSMRANEMLDGARDPALITSDPARQEMIKTAREAHALRVGEALDQFNIPREEVPAVTTLMTTGDWRAPTIPDNVKAFIGYANQLTDRFASQLTDQGLLGNFAGEYYDTATANRLSAAERRLASARAKASSYTIPRLTMVAGDNPRINNLIDLVSNAADSSHPGTFADANREITNMMKQTGGASPFSATQQASVDLIRAQVRAGTAAERVLERTTARSAPARFQPLIGKLADEELNKAYVAKGADPEQVTRAIVDRNYHLLDDLDPSLNPNSPAFDPRNRGVKSARMGFIDDITRTWQELKSQGSDPTFLHMVSPNQADRLDFIKTFPGKTSLSQTKLRTATPSAYVNDITVALDHQGQEILRRLASDDFMTQFMGTYGRTERDLVNQYLPQARLIAERSLGATDPMTVADSLMRRSHTPFDPTAYVNWDGAKVTGLDPERTWIPKPLADNIKLLYGDQDSFAKIMAPLQPINSAFRKAVLPLSPRFHTNNFFNNIIQMGTTLDPSVYGKFSRARELLAAVREGTDNTLGITIPDELRAELSRGVQKDLYAPQKYAAGSTLGRWFKDAREGNQSVLSRGTQALDSAGNVIDRIATKSFDIFETTEGIMRTMSYLYGYDKSLAKGLTSDVAARAGLESAYKTIQDLSQLTPMERSVIRNVIPFYGYMQHLIRYLWQFPADHPYRAAIFSSIARMEMDDHQTALPESMRNMIPFGEEDASGNRKALSLTGINPFTDAGDIFTFAGFVSAMNPLFKTVGQQLGLDFTGSADLHPNVHYDPSTGGLKLDAGNPITQLAYNTIPQSQLLSELIGTNKEFAEIMRTNPSTGLRMLASQVGLPVMLRSVNTRQGAIRTELERTQDRQQVLTDALKTGDDSQAALWPGMPGLLNQIRVLQSGGELSPYSSRAISPNAAQNLFGAGQQVVSPSSNQLPEFAQKYAR